MIVQVKQFVHLFGGQSAPIEHQVNQWLLANRDKIEVIGAVQYSRSQSFVAGKGGLSTGPTCHVALVTYRDLDLEEGLLQDEDYADLRETQREVDLTKLPF